MNTIKTKQFSEEIIKIQTIPFKDRKKIISNLCLFYKSNKLKSNLKNEELEKTEYENISLFEKILLLLTKEQRYFIKKSFLEDEKFHWSKSYYSKSTFYKKLHDSINNFLFLIYVN
ncbi:MG284/MPN403 family protein [[Mycoplasma] mobile]|uniref:Uncharacterized protein n=1 Tax=Mycoplasma mobile (strain ATCC 43663 / 163K / NCTC 11711) TaxID=267748 RepID=Q6KI73_MYCM1|nr:hypothetical protein [[Mycoplasma] mobile]AAT27703.1 conserved hypothetical protein [Mycoplasma mobile 163K]